MAKFNRIHGLSDVVRLPRAGKISLGLQVPVKGKEGVTRPKEVDYFVVPPEVAEVHGETPKVLDVMLPVPAAEDVFPVAYKLYKGDGTLVCCGDGQACSRLVVNKGSGEARMEDLECPGPEACEFCGVTRQGQPQCSKVGCLQAILYRVSMKGVYQISTRSWHSIVGLTNGLRFVESIAGKLTGIPLELTRTPQKIAGRDGRSQVHHILGIGMPTHARLKELLPEAFALQQLLGTAAAGGAAPTVVLPELPLPPDIEATVDETAPETTPADPPPETGGGDPAPEKTAAAGGDLSAASF